MLSRNVAILASLSLLFACGTPVSRPNLTSSVEKSSVNAEAKKGSIDSNVGQTQAPAQTPAVVVNAPANQPVVQAPGTASAPAPAPASTPAVVVDSKPAPVPSKEPQAPVPPKVSAALSADLMAKSSGRTKSSKTPMGSWFNDVVDYKPTADEQSLLSDPNKDVPIDGHADWVYKKFTVNLYPNGGKPDPADGGQRGIGDCNMLALLNSFAYQYPDFLKSIIADKGNGVFEISMFDPKAKPIKVTVGSNFMADKGGSLTQVAGKNNTANWITVLEKAIMKYNYVYKVWHGDGPAKVEGFGSEAGAPMLTGQGDSFSFDRGALAKAEDLTRVVKEALAAGKIITGGFGTPMELNGVKSVTGHAYTILVPSDKNIMISMRNPWGFSPKTDGGADNSKVGILDIPYLAEWFKTIDLRVIEPGIAGTMGQTQPYVVKPNTNFTGIGADDYELMVFLKFHPGI